MISPHFSVAVCPICGAGLCGIRICGLDTPKPYGLVVCDECEAIWTQPDILTAHQYPDDTENPLCPISGAPLWGPNSRWAHREDVQRLGWCDSIDSELSIEPGS
ncbi:MAG: hypothetical protein AAFP90_14265 [Planctomycetota bacterium]